MRFVKFKRNNLSIPEYAIVNNDIVKPVKNVQSISKLFESVYSGDISATEEIPLNEICLLPPVDDTASIYCAGLNYVDHALEMKMAVPDNPIFFSKSISSITGAYDNIIYPQAVQLLDYEIELALVVGRKIKAEDIITPANISEYILGITIFNDISARDQQLRAGQWFMGKSFRTFAPTGPFIQHMDEEVVKNLDNLILKLQVYDSDLKPYNDKKQLGNTSNMIFKPHELLNALSERFDLNPGDIISTGTPCNVALSKPGALKSRIAEIIGISQKKRTESFIQKEIRHNKKYLSIGDCIVSEIYSEDRTVNLGEQKNIVTAKEV